MSGDHRALIEEAGEHRQSPSGGMWCFLCRADWPCLPARLAEALAELHDHLQQASDEIRELAADRDAVLERAEQVEDALKKSAAALARIRDLPGADDAGGLTWLAGRIAAVALTAPPAGAQAAEGEGEA